MGGGFPWRKIYIPGLPSPYFSTTYIVFHFFSQHFGSVVRGESGHAGAYSIQYAIYRSRTCDRRFTKPLLYRLS